MHSKIWAIRHGKCTITDSDRLWLKYGHAGPPKPNSGRGSMLSVTLMASMLGMTGLFAERD